MQSHRSISNKHEYLRCEGVDVLCIGMRYVSLYSVNPCQFGRLQLGL